MLLLVRIFRKNSIAEQKFSPATGKRPFNNYENLNTTEITDFNEKRLDIYASAVAFWELGMKNKRNAN